MGAKSHDLHHLRSLALFHASVDASAVLEWITDFLGLELLAIPNLVVNLVLLAWLAFADASGPVWVLGEALVSRAFATFCTQTRRPPILRTM